MLAVLIGLQIALSSSAEAASGLINDSLQGVSCDYVNAAGRLAWVRQGGDWKDAKGVLHGNEPFAFFDVPAKKGRQKIEVDVTEIFRSRANDGEDALGLLIRAFGSGSATFNSRENSDVTSRPELLVTWSDGRMSAFPSAADSWISCTTSRSLGQRPTLKAGGADHVVLLFSIEQRPSHRVEAATLSLVSDRQSGGGASVGVFELAPPFGAGEAKSGIAANYPGDVGLENHPAVFLVERFESSHTYHQWTSKGSKRLGEIVDVTSEVGMKALQGKALKVTVPKGGNTALNTHFRFADQTGAEPEEAYFRYYIMLADNWNPTLEGGKLPGFAGTYGRGGWGGRPADGQNGWSARGAFFKLHAADNVLPDLRAVGSYVYHLDTNAEYGSLWGWNLGSTGMLEQGRWYAIEQYVRLNDPHELNGILRTWIDGVLAFEHTALAFRENDTLKIESLWLNVYHGGTKRAPRDLTLYLDNLIISSEYIGILAPLKNARNFFQ